MGLLVSFWLKEPSGSSRTGYFIFPVQHVTHCKTVSLKRTLLFVQMKLKNNYSCSKHKSDGTAQSVTLVMGYTSGVVTGQMLNCFLLPLSRLAVDPEKSIQ